MTGDEELAITPDQDHFAVTPGSVKPADSDPPGGEGNREGSHTPGQGPEDVGAVPPRLDLRYFTMSHYCPRMVHDGARRAFELFLFLAYRFLRGRGEPVIASHEQLCAACGLDPAASYARPTLSRNLRALRVKYRVLDFQPVKRKRPAICLLPPVPWSDLLKPQHYINFRGGWGAEERNRFDRLDSRAFAAEYMFFVARYESDLAATKRRRAYWFYPLERIRETYHISEDFAKKGLSALIDAGVLHVVYGQYRRTAPADEFGAANRYYFQDLQALAARQTRYAELQSLHGPLFDRAKELAEHLTNRGTIINIAGLCELIGRYGEQTVDKAIQEVDHLPTRSLKRRLAYIRGILREWQGE
jgi:hypothetical protein